MQYRVVITETTETVVFVEASSLDEAKDTATDAVTNYPDEYEVTQTALQVLVSGAGIRCWYQMPSQTTAD